MKDSKGKVKKIAKKTVTKNGGIKKKKNGEMTSSFSSIMLEIDKEMPIVQRKSSRSNQKTVNYSQDWEQDSAPNSPKSNGHNFETNGLDSSVDIEILSDTSDVDTLSDTSSTYDFKIKPKKKCKPIAKTSASTSVAKPQQTSDYFMKGDVMWFISIRKGRQERGMKRCQISELQNLPIDEFIFIELRVATEDTSYPEKAKRFATKCIPVGKISSNIHGTKSNGLIVGHEYLHAYSESDDYLQKVLEIFHDQLGMNESVNCICAAVKDQQSLYHRIIDEIFNPDEHFDYLIGEKTFSNDKKRFSNGENINESWDFPTSEEEEEIENPNFNGIELNPEVPDSNKSVQILDDVLNLDERASAPTFAVKKRKSRSSSGCRYNLEGISNDDVIKFFENSQSLRKHWQSIMDEGQCDRHTLATEGQSSKNMGTGSELQAKANISFLKQHTEKDGKNVDTELYYITRPIVEKHAQIGQLSEQMKERYAKHVLIPEGCERYLMDKFKMNEAEAKYWFLNYMAKDEDDDILEIFPTVQQKEIKPNTPTCISDEESENEDLIPYIE